MYVFKDMLHTCVSLDMDSMTFEAKDMFYDLVETENVSEMNLAGLTKVRLIAYLG